MKWNKSCDHRMGGAAGAAEAVSVGGAVAVEGGAARSDVLPVCGVDRVGAEGGEHGLPE